MMKLEEAIAPVPEHEVFRSDTTSSYLQTNLGQVHVRFSGSTRGFPLVLLHGVFLDGTLWDECLTNLSEFCLIIVDMPGHGQSEDVGHPWTIDECQIMLMMLLDHLKLRECLVLAHSWGAMTALRAAIKHPERFKSLCLCNMPYTESSRRSKLIFTLQKLAAWLPRFYAGKAAQSLYSPEILRKRPELRTNMQDRLSWRPVAEIQRVIDAVLITADDATELIRSLRVPTLFIIGERDYVGTPPGQVKVVPGGHISPQEASGATSGAAAAHFLASIGHG